MRMRTKKWARPELAVCPFFTEFPWEHRGSWHQKFARPDQPLYLELGCGKGQFIAGLSAKNPEINWLGLDLSSDMLGLSMRHARAEFAEVGREIDNLWLAWADIERIEKHFAPEDRVDRIFINFCNPWFNNGQYKKRLTHPHQLLQYRNFLADGGEIWFKTDSDLLFAHSCRYLEACGFTLLYTTIDLHADENRPESPETEHEQMYSAQGIPTKMLIARKEPDLPPQTVEALASGHRLPRGFWESR